MTLVEQLSILPEDEWIYLGSMSAYMYIAPASEMLTKLSYIDKVNIQVIRHDIKTARYSIHCTKKMLPLYEERGREEYEYALERISRLQEILAQHTQRLNNYQPVAERKVVEIYPRRFVKPYGTIVIITGSEIGRYMMASEITNGVVKSFDIGGAV